MISVVVPVHDEEESLATLHGELDAVFAGRCAGAGRVHFRRRRQPRRLVERPGRAGRARPAGRARSASAATSARRPPSRPRFKPLGGDLVFTLDGDLQDDPAEIPRFLAELEQGLDVVSGWKKTRHDPWHKVYPSRVFNWMVSRLTGCRLHDHNCGFKLYRREVLREVGIYGELHRFIPGPGACPRLSRRRGRGPPSPPPARRVQVRILAVPQGVSRPADRSFPDPVQPAAVARAGWHRPGALRPGQRGHALLAVLWLDPSNRPIGNRPLLFYSIALLLVGVQLLTLGILAELVTAYNIRAEDTFSIAETIPSQEQSVARR